MGVTCPRNLGQVNGHWFIFPPLEQMNLASQLTQFYLSNGTLMETTGTYMSLSLISLSLKVPLILLSQCFGLTRKVNNKNFREIALIINTPIEVQYVL